MLVPSQPPWLNLKILMMWNILALTFAIMYRGCSANSSKLSSVPRSGVDIQKSGKCAASTLDARAEVV